MQKRTNDAVQSFLDAERFGIECCRGGVMISKLVGIACESLGRSGLRPLVDNLDAAAVPERSRKRCPRSKPMKTRSRIALNRKEMNSGRAGREPSRKNRPACILYKQHGQNDRELHFAKFQKNQRERTSPGDRRCHARLRFWKAQTRPPRSTIWCRTIYLPTRS